MKRTVLTTLIALLSAVSAMAVTPTMVSATISNKTLIISPALGGSDIQTAVFAAMKGKDNDNITKIILTDPIVAGKDLYWLFSGYYYLKSIEGLDMLNTELVTTMNDMFGGCFYLESLDLSNFNTENVTDMYGIFHNCRYLKKIDMSNFNTAKVEKIDWMFTGVTPHTVILSNNIQSGIVTQIRPANDDGYEGVWNSTGTFLLPTKNGLSVAGTYTAKCTKYTITYHLDNGTNASANPDTYTVKDNITLAPASREGFTFEGWYYDAAFRNKVTKITKGNVELFAKFTETEYTITYHLDNGTNASTNPDTYTVEDNITLAPAIKGDYTFGGWYADNAYKNEVTQITTGNVELWAKWEEIDNAVETAQAADPFTRLQNTLYFAEPTAVEVYSISGVMLYSGETMEYTLPSRKGIYIIHTFAGAYKVMVNY